MEKRKLTLDREVITVGSQSYRSFNGGTTGIICDVITRIIEETIAPGDLSGPTEADCPPPPSWNSCNGPGTCGTCGSCNTCTCGTCQTCGGC